ncbi:hypothetical protein B0H63DRAFT_540469 [Podospora didyma]|uniref:Uncharacterized protein n=1 Tax=Podospora didyma TaxID=330526 RepID=A0AAE0NRV2_9PEZI|nr:hypothetical protein B0H63DRAFT_540469 [Podospora didyma]
MASYLVLWIHDSQAPAKGCIVDPYASRPGIKRLRSFHISIEFGHPTEGVQEQPKVLALAPEDCRGKIFTDELESSGTLGTGVPLGVLDLTANAEIQRGSANAVDRIAVWDCVEVEKAAKGVLPNFRAVIIVKYTENTPLQAVVKLDVERRVWNAWSRLFDWLTLFGKREDDPLLFDPIQPVGTPVGVEGLMELDLGELVKLQPILVMPGGYN